MPLRLIGRKVRVTTNAGFLLYTTVQAERSQARKHLLLLRKALNDAFVDGKLVIEGFDAPRTRSSTFGKDDEG